MDKNIDTIGNSIRKNKDRNRMFLDSYRERAAEEKIPQGIPKLPRVSEGELVMRRRSMRMLRAYSAHLFSNMAEGIQAGEDAFLLIDPDGCVVQMRTGAAFEEKIRSKGIVLGASWRLETTGADAVCVGIEEGMAFESVGEENYLTLFQDLALYYAPLRVMDEGRMCGMGGIVWITDMNNHSEAYMLLALSMASAINIRISNAWNTCESYEGDTRGVVQLDINMVNETVSVTHHNKKMFDMLRIAPMKRRECYFKPFSDFVDPLPDNQKLWEIVNERREVSDQEITIQVQGKKLNRIITTVVTAHPELKSRGVLLYITTRKDISHQVANRTGNNALMSFDDIVGKSPVMKNRIKRAKLLAGTESNILILGESGVGKDVFAQAIHNQSSRRNGPFVSVNCGALPRDLIASELFGYDAGAFTGARKQGNIGKFELAEGGTLFLDEIGEMPLDLQATLLRAVEQKQFMRLGSNRVIKADVRIISATNVDIDRLIREKRFRSDLYYRLSTMSMNIPPLREREGDVLLLAESFIRRISQKIGRQDFMEITPEAREFLTACPWRGNVRELQNLMECLVQLYTDHYITIDMIRENINPSYFKGTEFSRTVQRDPVNSGWSAQGEPERPEEVRPEPRANRAGSSSENETGGDASILTKEAILQALAICEGNRSKAAKYLNVGRRTLYRYIDRLGIGDKKYD